MASLKDLTQQYGIPIAAVVALLWGGSEMLKGVYKEGELGRAAIVDVKHELQLMRRDFQDIMRRVDSGVTQAQSNAWVLQLRAGLRSIVVRFPDGSIDELGKRLAEVIPDPPR